jgi:hypothetical protein
MRLSRTIIAAATVPLTALGVGVAACGGGGSAPVPNQVTQQGTDTLNSSEFSAPTVYSAATAGNRAHPGEAQQTMSVYYRDINWQNYAGAWEQYGVSTAQVNPVTNQSYSQFVAGYATTSDVTFVPYKDVTTLTTDTVYLNITADQTNGHVLTYTGWYTVNGRGGNIIAAHVVQTSGSAPRSAPSAPPMLASGIANQLAALQTTELAAAPASEFNYTGPGSVTVSVSQVTYQGTTVNPDSGATLQVFAVTFTDGVGDTGAATITATPPNAPGDAGWATSGVTWTGPYVTRGAFTTPAEAD